jgi:hypothetical protein
MKERDPALAQACFKGIVARLRDAMNSTIEADAPRAAHRRAGGD